MTSQSATPSAVLSSSDMVMTDLIPLVLKAMRNRLTTTERGGMLV